VPLLPPAAPPDSPGRRCRTALGPDDHPDRLALGALRPHDHRARQSAAAGARLDLGLLDAAYAGTGSPPHDPALLWAAVLFQTQRGQHSPAAWHRDAAASGPLRGRRRGLRPSRSGGYAFRDRLAPVRPALHAQPLHQAVGQGLTPATRASADGTTVAANCRGRRPRRCTGSASSRWSWPRRPARSTARCAASAGGGWNGPAARWGWSCGPRTCSPSSPWKRPGQRPSPHRKGLAAKTRKLDRL
jgi:hypothetical protein